MKPRLGVVLLAGLALGISLGQCPLFAQACKDDEAMVVEEKKSFAEMVETIKKESLDDFQRAYHQKSALSRLNLYDNITGGLISCLDKAAQDTTVPKEEADAYKAKRDLYAKLKTKIDQELNALKAATEPKDAKSIIEQSDVVK
jgi:hypothetical protein